MKKAVLLSMVIFLSFTGFSQKKYGEDSVKCVQNLSLYRDYYKQKMYDDAYKYWSIVYKICPAASERSYVDGANLVEHKLKNAKTEEEKALYIDSLLLVYDQRIANFGNEGPVLGRKGTDMLRYINDDPEAIFNTLDKSIELTGKSAEAGAIVSYMNAAVLMEKVEKKTEAEVVEIFSKLSDFLSYNIERFEGKTTQKYYKMAQERVESLAGPYLNCGILQKMAEENYENNKTDSDWMERMANILDKKGCTDAPIFFKIAKELHDNNPSAVSAEKMGVMSLKTKDYKAAESYFNQALEMAQDEEKKSDYYIELAEAQRGMGSYSAAKSNAKKAANLRANYGLPYLIIGDMIASSSSACENSDPCLQKAIYWLAIDYYNKAKSVDPSVASKANDKIATYRKYFPEKSDCFFKDIKEGDDVSIGCWINESTKARF